MLIQPFQSKKPYRLLSLIGIVGNQDIAEYFSDLANVGFERHSGHFAKLAAFQTLEKQWSLVIIFLTELQHITDVTNVYVDVM